MGARRASTARIRKIPLSLFVASALALLATSAAAAVGRTPGNFGVTPEGAATYTIPIFTPPGPNGVQPRIGLMYSSNGGIGPLGRGWSLAGLSAITRCNRTYAQDAVASAVALAASDGYCLDGNRLRLTSGTYGTAGSTYQTELANFSRVTASGTAGGGPASFTVKTRDGLTHEYGVTADARVMATGTSTASVWMLNRISDPSGNQVRFTYKTPDAGTTGTTIPLSIEWTATSHGASTFLYKMVFGYGNNTPPSSPVAYVAGTAVLNDDVLSSITVEVGGTTQRKYFLAYQTSPTTGALRLNAVTECSDNGGTDCLSPTSITYQNGQSGLNTSPTTAVADTTYALWRFDLNGDGFRDLVYSTGGSWYVRFGSSSGFGSPISTGLTGYLHHTFLVGDVRANGQDGILSLQGGLWHYYYWNGSSFSSSSTGVGIDSGNYTALADVDGDGRPDLVTVVASSGTLRYRLNTSTAGSASFGSLTSSVSVGEAADIFYPTDSLSYLDGRPLDFNGDGRADFALRTVTTFIWYEPLYGTPVTGYIRNTYLLVSAPAGGYTATLFDQNIDYMGGGGAAPPPAFLDINDDGCTDIALLTVLTISGCGGAATIAAYPSDAQAVLDWNGDGRSDVLALNGSTLNVHLSNGKGFNAPIASGLPYQLGQWKKADIDGDGLDDLVFRPLGGAPTPLRYFLHKGAGQTPDLAIEFKDGFDVKQTVSYTPATWNNYTRQSNATAPNVDYAGPMRIVASSTHSDGIGGTYTLSYWYYGAERNREGRGFAGFASRQVTDSRTNAYTQEYYRRDFPYTGFVSETRAYQSGGTLISQQIRTPGLNTLDVTSNNQRYFVYPSTYSASQYEVGGAGNGALILQASGSSTFDSYGNQTSQSTTVTDKDSSSPQYNQSWTQAVTNTYSVDTGSWCLVLPSTSSQTYTATNGEASVTRTQSFTPDTTNCRLSAQSVEPYSSTRRVDTSLGYDSFGNVNSVSVTGRTSAGATMTTRTSSGTWGTTGQFPLTQTNAVGHVTTRTFNGVTGQLATETDPSGVLQVSNTFDSFQRLHRSTRADSTSTVYTYAYCGGSYPCENGDKASGATGINKTVLIASERNTSDAEVRKDITYLDQFDRPIVQKAQTLSGGFSRSGRQYDNLGRVYRETVPCDDSSCSQFWITNAYDLMNRVITQTRPESQSVSTPVTTTFAYNRMTQTVTDPQGKVSTKILDVAGRMRRSQDHDGYFQNFGYDAFGSLKSVSDSLSNTLFQANYSYGIQAFQDSTTDMDLGTWSYFYNSLGERTSWTDAKSQSFTQTWDAISRPLVRTDPDMNTYWNWGTSGITIGRLSNMGSTTTNYSEGISYDSIGRTNAVSITVGGASYNYNFSFDNTGRLSLTEYPTSTSSTRVAIRNTYQYGILNKVQDNTGGALGTIYWQASSHNARGQITGDQLGNGIVRSRAFDAVTGWQANVQAGVGSGAGVLNQSYGYDLVGNVTQRQDSNAGLTENFYYDNLYRLDYSQLNGVTNLDVTYNAMGNITARSDVGGGATWTYHATKKHAVTSAGGVAYGYDANGNMTSRGGATITWTSFNYPSALPVPGGTATFNYGPNRQYISSTMPHPDGGPLETTQYIGGLLERSVRGGDVDWRHYVKVHGETVTIISRKSSGVNTANYVLSDHQGSPAVLANSSGGTLLKESYAAFGGARNASTWSGSPSSGDQITMANLSRRGYTDHLMAGFGGLIHMNGRVQDSVTGRFLSPDLQVPHPGLTQSFNRYSYVRNNPLSYIDPSGFAEGAPHIGFEANVTAPRWSDGGIFHFGNLSNSGSVGGPAITGEEWEEGVRNHCLSSIACQLQEKEETPEETPEEAPPQGQRHVDNSRPCDEEQSSPQPTTDLPNAVGNGVKGGGTVGVLGGLASGAAWGLRMAVQEAPHLTPIVRILATSEAVYSGAMLGAATGIPIGMVLGVAAGVTIELAPLAVDAAYRWVNPNWKGCPVPAMN